MTSLNQLIIKYMRHFRIRIIQQYGIKKLKYSYTIYTRHASRNEERNFDFKKKVDIFFQNAFQKPILTGSIL